MFTPLVWVLISTAALAFAFFILLLRQGANPIQWGAALGQIAFVWVLSNSPIGLLLLESGLDPNSSSIFDLLNKEVRYAEAIIYVAAILAPVLYTLIWNFRPVAKVYVLINIGGVILCMGSASYIYARHLANVPSDIGTLAGTTMTIYILSLIFWYFSTVYELIVTNPAPGESATNRANRIRESLP